MGDGKRAIVVGLVALMLAAFALAGFVTAQSKWVTLYPSTLYPSENIIVQGRVLSARLGGGDQLVLNVELSVTNKMSVEQIISFTILVYDGAELTVRYARAGFHHVVLPPLATVSVFKTIRVHHNSMFQMDSDGWFVAWATTKRDGVVFPATASGPINFDDWKPLLAGL